MIVKYFRSIMMFFLLAHLCLFCSGCSIILLDKGLAPITEYSKWEKKRTTRNFYTIEAVKYRYALQYRDNDILLKFPKYYDIDRCGISLGPPIFPVIPYFFRCFSLKDRGHLDFPFVIENYGNAVSIDIHEIKLIDSTDKILTHDSAHYCTSDEKYVFSCSSTKAGLHYQTIPDTPITIEKGSKVLIYLDYKDVNFEGEIKFILGKISSLGSNFNIQPLTFRRGYYITYCPLSIIGHEPCF